jgi:hypothetical protein
MSLSDSWLENKQAEYEYDEQQKDRELKNKINISTVDHSETAWVRDIELEYEGKSYSVKLSWTYEVGYDIEGVETLPVDVASDRDALCSILDELSLADLKAGGWRGGWV